MPHIHALYDFTITAIIVNQDRVLLLNHPRYNKWLPIGGHIELSEDPEQALHREILEETGLSNVRILSTKPNFDSPGTKPLVTPNYVDVHEANLPHKHISFTYFVTSENSDFVLSAEHEAMRWFTEDELNLPEYQLSVAVKFYALEALKSARNKAPDDK